MIRQALLAAAMASPLVLEVCLLPPIEAETDDQPVLVMSTAKPEPPAALECVIEGRSDTGTKQVSRARFVRAEYPFVMIDPRVESAGFEVDHIGRALIFSEPANFHFRQLRCWPTNSAGR